MEGSTYSSSSSWGLLTLDLTLGDATCESLSLTFCSITAMRLLKFLSSCRMRAFESGTFVIFSLLEAMSISVTTLHFEFMGLSCTPPHFVQSKTFLGIFLHTKFHSSFDTCTYNRVRVKILYTKNL